MTGPCNMDRDFWWGALVVGWCLCGVALMLVGACLGLGKLGLLLSVALHAPGSVGGSP